MCVCLGGGRNAAFALLGYKVRGGGAYVCVFGGGRNAAFALLGYKARGGGVCVGGGGWNNAFALLGYKVYKVRCGGWSHDYCNACLLPSSM